MYCKNCGKIIDDDSKFCNYCGTEHKSAVAEESTEQESGDVEIPTASTPDTKQEKPKEPKKGNKAYYLLIFLIIGFIIAMVIYKVQDNNGYSIEEKRKAIAEAEEIVDKIAQKENAINDSEDEEPHSEYNQPISPERIVYETFDGDFVFKPIEINSISEFEKRKETYQGANIVMYYLALVDESISSRPAKEKDAAMRKAGLNDLTLNITLDFNSIDNSAYINFAIKSLDLETYNDIQPGTDLISFGKTRRISALGQGGKYSLGKYDIQIRFISSNNNSGQISIKVNGEVMAEKDITKKNSPFGIIIVKSSTTPAISHLHLKTSQIAFVNQDEGQIIK